MLIVPVVRGVLFCAVRCVLLQASAMTPAQAAAAAAALAPRGRCSPVNRDALLPLYATSGPGGFPRSRRKAVEDEKKKAVRGWVDGVFIRTGTNATWCAEVTTQGLSCPDARRVVDWRGQALEASTVVQVSL